MHRINPDWTVSELLRQIPESAPALHRLGLDTCCGGALTLAQAAASVGRSRDALIAELSRTGGPAAEGDACCSIRH